MAIFYLACYYMQAACDRKLNNAFYIIYQSGHCRPPAAVLCTICIAIVQCSLNIFHMMNVQNSWSKSHKHVSDDSVRDR